jgi:hypothetical protein
MSSNQALHERGARNTGMNNVPVQNIVRVPLTPASVSTLKNIAYLCLGPTKLINCFRRDHRHSHQSVRGFNVDAPKQQPSTLSHQSVTGYNGPRTQPFIMLFQAPTNQVAGRAIRVASDDENRWDVVRMQKQIQNMILCSVLGPYVGRTSSCNLVSIRAYEFCAPWQQLRREACC